MSWIILILPVVILALVAVTIYEHVSSVTLSLALTPVLTFLTILLPLLAGANFFSLPHLASKPPRNNTSSVFRYISPVVLHALQGIFTTVLATLYFADIAPSVTRECKLSTRWQHLFRTKDERAIRAIQDAFQCCGFRSVKDMAWPFPPTAVQCPVRFDRAMACQGPWTSALQESAAVNFAVVLAVGALQVLGILIATRYNTGRISMGFWTGLSRHWGQRNSEEISTRPLITGQREQIEQVDEEMGEDGIEHDPRYSTMEAGRGSGSTN